MSIPSCDYCERLYSDPRGCAYVDDDERPVRYGDEQHPMSATETCRDCGTPLCQLHHPDCACAECGLCHRQFHPGLTCAEDAELTTPGAAA